MLIYFYTHHLTGGVYRCLFCLDRTYDPDRHAFCFPRFQSRSSMLKSEVPRCRSFPLLLRDSSGPKIFIAFGQIIEIH